MNRSGRQATLPTPHRPGIQSRFDISRPWHTAASKTNWDAAPAKGEGARPHGVLMVARANTEAERLMAGDGAAAAALGARLLKPRRDNLVERPWGGHRLRDFKRLGAAASRSAIGESFELAADDSDDEARKYPSVIDLPDGSNVTLPALLSAHAETLLGADFVGRYGRRLPLLPKLLDVAELLSVQAHPPGGTEVYVIVAADPGATLRLGFSRDADAKKLARQFADGRRE